MYKEQTRIYCVGSIAGLPVQIRKVFGFISYESKRRLAKKLSDFLPLTHISRV